MRLVMQRSGRLLNFAANQDASAPSSGPLGFFWCSAWVRLISSFCSHLPKKKGGWCAFKDRAVGRKQHLGSLWPASGPSGGSCRWSDVEERGLAALATGKFKTQSRAGIFKTNAAPASRRQHKGRTIGQHRRQGNNKRTDEIEPVNNEAINPDYSPGFTAWT